MFVTANPTGLALAIDALIADLVAMRQRDVCQCALDDADPDDLRALADLAALGLSDEHGRAVVAALAKGQIRHCRVEY